MKDQAAGDPVAAGSLQKVAVGEPRAVERAQGEKAVNDAFGVAHRHGLGADPGAAGQRQDSAGDRERAAHPLRTCKGS
jgi:hypothetical protein